MKENKDIVAFELWDLTGKLVARYGEIDKLPVSFRLKPTENFQEGKFRNIYRKNSFGVVRLITDINDPLFQGTKGISRGCEVYLSLIPKFKQIESGHRRYFESIIRRFAHNLIKFQIRFRGNFSRLISDTARSRPFSEFQDEVKRRIENNTNVAAQDVCQMSHRAVDLDAQIETLRVISGFAESSPDSVIKVDLLNTIYRLVNPFITELQTKGIVINIDILSSKLGGNKVVVSPSLFNAAIWQILDNASKYVLHNTEIIVKAYLNENPQKLEFLMTSICIDEDELELVFLEGYKGRNAGNKAENGIGLFIVKKALSLMSAEIKIQNDGFVCINDNYKYCKHRFIITFAPFK